MEGEKTVIFAFRGDPMCFIHVLLNGIDLHEKEMGGDIVIEGEAVKLVEEMSKPGHFLSGLFIKARQLGIIHGACKACSKKLKVDGAIEKAEIPLIGEMAGHPSMADFIKKGYHVITF